MCVSDLSSCTFPKTYYVQEDPKLVEYRCLKLRQEGFLARNINFCPIMESKPSIPKKWMLRFDLEDDFKGVRESSPIYGGIDGRSLENKTCEFPTYKNYGTEYRMLDIGTKIKVLEITNWWEFENGNRLSVHGSIELENGKGTTFDLDEYLGSTDYLQRMNQLFESCHGNEKLSNQKLQPTSALLRLLG